MARQESDREDLLGDATALVNRAQVRVAAWREPVFFGFRRQQVGHPLNGFGVLIPHRENRRILGALWNSSLFPSRAPAGHVAFTCFLGGMRHPELVSLDEDRLLALCDQKTGVDSAFKLADDVLRHGVQAIAEVITTPGLINLDFADVKAVMSDAGPAWMSIGRGTGQNRATDAAKEALASPLLDVSIEGSKAVLFNVVGGTTLTLYEVNQAADVIKQAVDPDANIIFGVANEPAMENEIRITLITTGFTAKLAPGGAEKEDELTQLLKGLKTEEELDVPSFLRRPLFSHRRLTTTPAEKPVEQPKQAQFM